MAATMVVKREYKMAASKAATLAVMLVVRWAGK